MMTQATQSPSFSTSSLLLLLLRIVPVCVCIGDKWKDTKDKAKEKYADAKTAAGG